MATLLPKTNHSTSLLSSSALGRCNAPTAVSLAQAVMAAVQQIDERQLQPVSDRTVGLAFQPRFMLALLTYCYARQWYGGSEILDYMLQHKTLRELCHEDLPSLRQIHTFRQQNRSFIEKCLTAALRFLGEQKIASGFVTRIHETIIAEEAKRRIIMAACMDSLELEHGHQPFSVV